MAAVAPELLGRLLRALPVALPGKARLARALLGSQRDRLGAVTVTGPSGLPFRVPNIREPIGWHFFIDGRYEPLEVDWVLAQLRPGDTFIDCGANIGTFTIPAAHRVGPTGRVLAIDASPRVLPYLHENIRMNGLTNVMVCHAALDVADGGTLEFFEMPAESFGSGSLMPRPRSAAVSVPRRSLDALVDEHRIGTAAVVKIDVEGLEHAIITGGRQTFARLRPAVIFEFIASEEAKAIAPGHAQEMLLGLGYRLWRLEDAARREVPMNAPLTSGDATIVGLPGR